MPPPYSAQGSLWVGRVDLKVFSVLPESSKMLRRQLSVDDSEEVLIWHIATVGQGSAGGLVGFLSANLSN